MSAATYPEVASPVTVGVFSPAPSDRRSPRRLLRLPPRRRRHPPTLPRPNTILGDHLTGLDELTDEDRHALLHMLDALLAKGRFRKALRETG